MQFPDENALISFAINAKMQEWQKKLICKYKDDLQVHSKGELFYKIDTLFPNEHPESKKQRVLSFEPITKSSFEKGLNNIVEIFNNSSYTAEASQKTIDLISQNTFDNKNLFSFLLEKWTKTALGESANDLMVIYPFEYIKDYPETQQITFVKTEFINKYDNDGIVIFVSEQESDKTYSVEEYKICGIPFWDNSLAIPRWNIRHSQENSFSLKLKTKITRTVLHVFTEDGMYRIEQDKDQTSSWSYEFYPSKVKFIPVTIVGGVEREKKFIHESFFQTCVPFANLALLQHSQHTAVNFMFSFPRMGELQSSCDNDGCNNGRVLCETTNQYPDGTMPCPTCLGSGTRAAQTPYKVYVKKYDTSDMSDNKHLDVDDVKYYTPDTGILKYSKEEWGDYLEKMEKTLFIQQVVKTGNVQSEESKQIDLKGQYSFLKRIATVFYDKVRFAMQCYENYLNNAGAQNVVVNIPYSFAILDESDAFDALNNILKSDASILIKANQMESFINKFISQSSVIIKFFTVLKIVDKLFFYSNADINLFSLGGVADKQDWAVHVYAYPVLMQMYMKNRDLFNDDMDKIADALIKELDQYKPQPANTLQENVSIKLNDNS